MTKTTKVNAPAAEAGSVNCYKCDRCGELTIALHIDAGVTPFMMRCRAKASCQGIAYSQNYPREIPDPLPAHHIEWFRPANVMDAIEAIGREQPQHREAMLEHYRLGGCLMREVTR